MTLNWVINTIGWFSCGKVPLYKEKSFMSHIPWKWVQKQAKCILFWQFYFRVFPWGTQNVFHSVSITVRFSSKLFSQNIKKSGTNEKYIEYFLISASYIKRCSVSTPDFDDCCLRNGREAIPHLQNGDRTYDIPKMLPLVFPSISFETGPDFSLAMTNLHIFGLETANLKGVK